MLVVVVELDVDEDRVVGGAVVIEIVVVVVVDIELAVLVVDRTGGIMLLYSDSLVSKRIPHVTLTSKPETYDNRRQHYCLVCTLLCNRNRECNSSCRCFSRNTIEKPQPQGRLKIARIC